MEGLKNETNKITITNKAIFSSEIEIDDRQKELAEYNSFENPNEGNDKEEALAAKRRLESYCDKIQEKCTETYKWLHANPELADKEQYELRCKELERIFNPSTN